MASLEQRLTDVLTRIGTEFKSVRAVTGSLGSLVTTDKTSLVAAINEVSAAVGGAGASIDDNTISTLSVWSSNKTNTAINNAAAALVASAPATLDTLNELAAALGNDANFSTTVTTALSNRVRFDAAQSLTSQQQAQAQTNIGVLAASAIGNPDRDLVADFEAALV